METLLNHIVATLAGLGVIWSVAGDPVEAALQWQRDMTQVHVQQRCAGQASASGARGSEWTVVRDACVLRINASEPDLTRG